MFNERQKKMLMSVARNTQDPNMGKINEKLDHVIAQLQRESSRSFLTDEDLKNRVFFYKPKNLDSHEYLGYVHEFMEK